MSTWMHRALAAAGLILLTAAGLALTGPFGEPDLAALSDPDDAALVAAGRELYAVECAGCHGERLEGQADWDAPSGDGPAPAPPHDVRGHTWHHGDGLLFDYIRHGGAEMALRLNISGFDSGMPSFGDRLSDAEIGAILAFIKSHWPERQLQYQREASAAER